MELSRVNDCYLWTEKPEMITNDFIGDVIGLCSTRPMSVLKFGKNKDVMESTGATFDYRDLTVDTIQNP